MKTKNSDFQFQGFLISKSLIELSPLTKKRELSINIVPSGKINQKENSFQLTLEIQINKPGDNIYLNVTGVGEFKFENEIENTKLGNYFYLNAPAILFPYIRSYISTLTTLSGIQPINLPTLNLMGYRDELKNNTQVL